MIDPSKKPLMDKTAAVVSAVLALVSVLVGVPQLNIDPAIIVSIVTAAFGALAAWRAHAESGRAAQVAAMAAELAQLRAAAAGPVPGDTVREAVRLVIVKDGDGA